jgi:hypothetical protein
MPRHMDDGLIEALHVDGPAGQHADELMLFGRFVGSWELDWRGTNPDGSPATMRGELHFGWVLGGRAGAGRLHQPGPRVGRS